MQRTQQTPKLPAMGNAQPVAAAQHTQWRAVRHTDMGRGRKGPMQIETRDSVIASVMIAGTPDEQERRAALLAAAPDLLAALRALVEHHDSYPSIKDLPELPAWTRARAAITKAEATR